MNDTHVSQRCWAEAAILAFGVPAASALMVRLVTVTVPLATTGSVGARFLLRISGGVIVEWAFVAAIWLILKRRRSSFADLGVWKVGTWSAWAVALTFSALSIASNLRLLPTMGVPISSAFMPRGFHLSAALILGITAGFCEEVLFRAFLMTEFRNAGFGRAIQVVFPGIAFGLAHLSYSNLGVVAVIGIMVPTAVLGMIWGIAYLLGRGSLVPVVVAHFLNDSTALPWIVFMIFMSPGQ